MDTERITSYHAHVYFDADTLTAAKAVIAAAAARFALEVGRIHERPVGPHPCWSCQLAFPADLFGHVIPWLALNRDGLTVFVHPNTGQDLEDHRDRAIWLGDSVALRLEMFTT